MTFCFAARLIYFFFSQNIFRKINFYVPVFLFLSFSLSLFPPPSLFIYELINIISVFEIRHFHRADKAVSSSCANDRVPAESPVRDPYSTQRHHLILANRLNIHEDSLWSRTVSWQLFHPKGIRGISRAGFDKCTVSRNE